MASSYKITANGTRMSNTAGLSGNAWTISGWFRRDSSAGSNGWVYGANSAGNTLRAEMQTTANGADIRLKEGSGFDGTDSVFSVANDEWVYVALGSNGTSYFGYCWRDTTSEDRTDLGGATPGGATFTPTTMAAGGDTGTAPYWFPALGEFRYMRYWNDDLTTTELNTERLSATAVKTTSLVGDWLLANSTDTADISGNARTLTSLGSPSSGTTEPASVGAGGSSGNPYYYFAQQG